MTNILEQENTLEAEGTAILQNIQDQTKQAIHDTIDPFNGDIYYNNFGSINNKDMGTISLFGLKVLQNIYAENTSPESSRGEALEQIEQYLQEKEKETIKKIDFEDRRTVAKFFRESGGIIKHYLNIIGILALQKSKI